MNDNTENILINVEKCVPTLYNETALIHKSLLSLQHA